MPVLLLRLAGPMQSWGVVSRFSHRDTAREPSKSGVIGLLCAALGVPRDDDKTVARLAALPMGVRVNREGVMEVDFQTVGGGKVRGGPYGVARANEASLVAGRTLARQAASVGRATGGTIISHRDYLAEADFLVGLESEDVELLWRLDEALRSPRWPLYLGRRGHVPGVAPAVDLTVGPMPEALRTWPPAESRRPGTAMPATGTRLVLEAPYGAGEPRYDVPVSFHPQRRAFRLRYVTTQWIES